MANNYGGGDRYRPILASAEGGDIRCNSGLVLAGATALEDLPDGLDTILVAGGSEAGLRGQEGGPLIDWLVARRDTTRRIGSVCSGALVLAATGLLDGRRATTHWGACACSKPAIQTSRSIRTPSSSPIPRSSPRRGSRRALICAWPL